MIDIVNIRNIKTKGYTRSWKELYSEIARKGEFETSLRLKMHCIFFSLQSLGPCNTVRRINSCGRGPEATHARQSMPPRPTSYNPYAYKYEKEFDVYSLPPQLSSFCFLAYFTFSPIIRSLQPSQVYRLFATSQQVTQP